MVSAVGDGFIPRLGVILGDKDDSHAGDNSDDTGAEQPVAVKHILHGEKHADNG